MNDTRDFDRAVARWLDAGSDATRPEVIDAVLLAVRSTPQERDLRALRTASPMAMYMGLAAVLAIVAVAGASALYALGLGPNLGFGPADDPVSPFHGTWVSTTDEDGGTQTMKVHVSADGPVEITVRDDVATVCGGTPSTMTGAGRVEGGTQLVIPAPVYTCDDGTEPESISGPPLEELLRDWTLVLDPQADTLSDRVGGVWRREGAELPSPDPTVTISDTAWPQSSLEEVQEAQRRADAGDPDYTWQVAARWNEVDQFAPIELELVDRFIREVLGWEAYLFNEFEGGDFNASVGAMDGWADGALTDGRYLRCAPGRTNPLYPPQPGSEQLGHSCAPTLDDVTYESVSLDLVQPDRQGRDGIWVVNRWHPMTFAQVDPTVAEAQATERLEEFLAARIAGRGAEGLVDVYADWVGQVPLLYATTSGAPYERFEFERVAGPEWPYGGYIEFRISLFAEDGTVVEQRIESHWDGGRSVGIEGGLGMASMTTENGEPVPMPHEQFDGEVTYSSPSPSSWRTGDLGVGDDGFLDFTDPAAFWSDCEQGPAPADAAAFAQAVIGNRNFETTPPVAARVGGIEAVALDVALAPAGRVCGPYRTDVHQWINSLEPGKRLRLFLVDVPEGMSMRTLAITVMATEARFEEVVEEATPIIDSIEFHPD